MVLTSGAISDRDLNFRLNRINILDQEITRYRDYEWKATSFHTGFFVAILYLLINTDTQQNLINAIGSKNIIVYFILLLYLGIACGQLIDIHKKLDRSRVDRDNHLFYIGEPESKGNDKDNWFHNWIYIILFIIWLIVLFVSDSVLWYYSEPCLFCLCCT
ncbi:MAG: hypothetical protein MPEBLZ_02256 [Candidatus Methanoperedens nitroreducens]|uniref:Uncharacterized protein n=1 Tax=Candidatus Methanoperedens nitratireducens TaxID=1392998 RepID=A0A0P8CJR5_9EURY|nr:MAG: hypothetical protein MPEBLZ_02256 [Candidatus Methanoperedens sp. BLZ1]CAG1004519.1 hypothetical protein METP2_03562 [Methanosarcinales archaeon]